MDRISPEHRNLSKEAAVGLVEESTPECASRPEGPTEASSGGPSATLLDIPPEVLKQVGDHYFQGSMGQQLDQIQNLKLTHRYLDAAFGDGNPAVAKLQARFSALRQINRRYNISNLADCSGGGSVRIYESALPAAAYRTFMEGPLDAQFREALHSSDQEVFDQAFTRGIVLLTNAIKNVRDNRFCVSPADNTVIESMAHFFRMALPRLSLCQARNLWRVSRPLAAMPALASIWSLENAQRVRPEVRFHVISNALQVGFLGGAESRYFSGLTDEQFQRLVADVADDLSVTDFHAKAQIMYAFARPAILHSMENLSEHSRQLLLEVVADVLTRCGTRGQRPMPWAELLIESAMQKFMVLSDAHKIQLAQTIIGCAAFPDCGGQIKRYKLHPLFQTWRDLDEQNQERLLAVMVRSRHDLDDHQLSHAMLPYWPDYPSDLKMKLEPLYAHAQRQKSVFMENVSLFISENLWEAQKLRLRDLGFMAVELGQGEPVDVSFDQALKVVELIAIHTDDLGLLIISLVELFKVLLAKSMTAKSMEIFLDFANACPSRDIRLACFAAVRGFNNAMTIANKEKAITMLLEDTSLRPALHLELLAWLRMDLAPQLVTPIVDRLAALQLHISGRAMGNRQLVPLMESLVSDLK